MTWLKQNFNLGNIITILVVVVGMAGNLAVNSYRIGRMEQNIERLEQRVAEHTSSQVIHVNQRADEDFRAYVKESLARIEAQVERLRDGR